MAGAAVFSLGTFVADIVHGAALVFAFSAFGSLLFLTVLSPPAMVGMELARRMGAEDRCATLAAWSLVLAVVGEIGWLIAESGVLAGAGITALLGAVPVVVRDTEFGHLVLAQIAVLLLAFIVLGRRRSSARSAVAASLSGFAVFLEAWHLHAAAMIGGPSFFLACEAVHVLAAAAWLGSLLPLALFVRNASPQAGVTVAFRYSAFAKPLVVALLVTAAWQSLVLIGSISAFFTTTYGRVAIIKIVLFAILIGFALRHRFRMVPTLASIGGDAVRRKLERSVLAETAFGIAIVVVAAILASLAPPTMAATG